MNDKFELYPEEWEKIRDTLFDAMSKKETPIYEPKMNAFLEQAVYQYLRPTNEPISLTDIARRFEPNNPSYLIQSWLRSRNTIEFLREWERNHNRQFNEEAFQKLLKDVRSPSYNERLGCRISRFFIKNDREPHRSVSGLGALL